MIKRQIQAEVIDRLNKGKVIVLVGARQVGKTTLTNQLIASYPKGKTLVYNGDNLEAQKLSKMSSSEIKSQVAKCRCLLIDEAHKINRIGDITKSLVDEFGDQLQVILTGSSTINLVDKTAEPLTGRKRVFELHPIALAELNYSPQKIANSWEDIFTVRALPRSCQRNFDKRQTRGLG